MGESLKTAAPRCTIEDAKNISQVQTSGGLKKKINRTYNLHVGVKSYSPYQEEI